ncbi:hypothetical protein KKF45_01895, partial [Patescibacteria group bacterium]|nr:hypothetical protein [Patescibacteria group bacterium]
MKMTTSTIALVVASLLLGQGCPTKTDVPTDTTVTQPPAQGITGKKAFGKLPSLGSAAIAENGAVGTGGVAGSNLAVAAPMMATDAAQTKESSAIGRPIPAPYPNPGTVTYDLDVPTPSWSEDGDVFRLDPVLTPLPSASRLVQDLGVPSQALGSDANLTNLNVSWIDGDGMQWTYDANNHMVSFWKNRSDMMREDDGTREPPTVDDAEYLRIAHEFFAQKGFGGVTLGTGSVEKPWGDGDMRCPMPLMEDATVSSEPSGSGEAVAMKAIVAPDVGTTSIARCWWPGYQINVVYEGVRDGKRLVDAGGWPWRAANVSIDPTDKSVTGGSIYLDRAAESSQYPLISKEEAEKRLRSGGRNPLYVWESGNVSVHIKTLDLVFMR